MPRAKPFPDSEDEEKTTVESPWEEEASTTVEQGDVAEKIRALGVEPRGGGTNVTSTSAGPIEEPTVDEQHLSALTPVRDIARIQITQGNDAGNELEIRPGKTYTIGRAIDNDVVLTDIAVSRKHFDLRFEDGAWVIVDRGSGNGTVVNGNLEDNPFMLANDDVIEIGNTAFRFDHPSSTLRPQRTMELDDEELSTVAGKPLRAELAAIQPVVAAVRPARAKTLPPPTPLRAANASQPPPLGYPPLGPQSIAQPASPVPMPQMASRSPIGTPVAPAAPAILGADLVAAQSPMPAVLPVTSAPQRPMYGYPQATEIPPHSVHAQMLLIQTQNRRGDGSTLHVPPTPFDGVPAPPRYQQPQLSKRTKLVLAGIGLAVFAAVMTIAIVKSGHAKTSATAKTSESSAQGEAKIATTPKASVEPILDSTPAEATPGPDEQAGDDPVKPTTAQAEPEKAVPEKAEPEKAVPEKAVPEKAEPEKAEPKQTARTGRRREPKSTRNERREPKRTRNERREPRRETAVEPKRVAAGIDADEAKDRAERLYRAKKFGEASSYLASAAKNVDEDDARRLRRTADMYAKLGRAFAVGTAPATKSTTAFEALRQAQNYDRNVGNAFDDEIRKELSEVAPRAALSYVAAKKFPSARNALLVAQQFGSSETLKIVEIKLESAANDLYNEAMRELRSDPDAAKDKFRQIKSIVGSSSPWYQRAQKQLRGS